MGPGTRHSEARTAINPPETVWAGCLFSRQPERGRLNNVGPWTRTQVQIRDSTSPIRIPVALSGLLKKGSKNKQANKPNSNACCSIRSSELKMLEYVWYMSGSSPKKEKGRLLPMMFSPFRPLQIRPLELWWRCLREPDEPLHGLEPNTVVSE